MLFSSPFKVLQLESIRMHIRMSWQHTLTIELIAICSIVFSHLFILPSPMKTPKRWNKNRRKKSNCWNIEKKNDCFKKSISIWIGLLNWIQWRQQNEIQIIITLIEIDWWTKWRCRLHRGFFSLLPGDDCPSASHCVYPFKKKISFTPIKYLTIANYKLKKKNEEKQKKE